jgi:predicted Ser/Thr protein kinase
LGSPTELREGKKRMAFEKIGRYEVRGEIGRGGMATVFQAYDPRFERDVAIKVLPSEFTHDAQFRTRFEREAKTIALLEHPAIVPVYDFGEEEGQPYIVMRYMSGGSLAERLKGPMAANEVVQLFSRLAPALDAAHARGIIHRDLKPGNILFDQYGNSFLSDFGIARMAQNPSAATLTGGNILGTPAYMSPEQIQGDKELDGRSDIYAMGVILYQLLTGSAPYQATTPARVMMMHILEPVPQILQNRPDLPETVQEVLAKAMAKEPDDRYPTNNAMAEDISSALHGFGSSPALRDISDDKTMIGPAKTALGATRQVPGKTVVAPARTVVAPGKASSTPGKRPGEAVVDEAAALPKKGSFPIWLMAVIGVVLLAIVGAAVLGGGLLLGGGSKETPTQEVAIVATTVPTNTQPVPTNTVPVPTETTAPVVVPTEPPTNTPEPSATPEPTATEVPKAPVIGGADKIAFINRNDIWVANVDGSELEQITSDGAKKTEIQWLPDGSGLVYIKGKCIEIVEYPSSKVTLITCFSTAIALDAFTISPDGKQVAISINQEYMFVVPFDIEKLSQAKTRDGLKPLGTCPILSPYGPLIIKSIRWSKDGQRIAFVFAAPVAGRREDTIRVINNSRCYTEEPPRAVREFPSTFFTMKGWNSNAVINHFGYDGVNLFVMNGYFRNGGFGDLYLFNTELYRVDKEVNPIDKKCCYRDAEFSPDGQYLVFAFQDTTSENKIQLYMVPVGTLNTGERYTPIPLPDDFFPNRDDSPQPVLRQAKP